MTPVVFGMSQVVKLIQKLANTSSVRESYMKPLESFVKSHHDELMVRRLRVRGVRGLMDDNCAFDSV